MFSGGVAGVYSGNGRHEEMNRPAIACSGQAMGDVGLDPDGLLWRDGRAAVAATAGCSAVVA